MTVPPLSRWLARRTALAARALVAGGLVGVLSLLAMAPAHAHDDVGTLTVAEATASGNAVSYAVDVVFVNDGHPASDATVTVVAEGPAGATVGPLSMTETATAGRYGATVDFSAPGGWTVRFTSLTPLGTTETTQEVGAPASGTSSSPTLPGPTQPVPTLSATTVQPGSTTQPPTTAVTSPVTTGEPGGYEPDDFAGTGTRVLLIAGLVAVLGAASALTVVRRRGRGH